MKMKCLQRRLILWAVACCLSSTTETSAHGATGDSTQSDARPNILLILADDLGWSDLGCYGNELFETPNLDRLADEGVRFTQGYSPAPICSASRAGILTGKTPARLGFEFVTKSEASFQPMETPLRAPRYTLDLPLEEVTIAETLGDAGYRTAFFGKWHVNQHYKRYLGWSPTHGPLAQGFDVAEEDFGSHPYSYWGSKSKREPLALGDGEFAQDSMTHRAVRFLRDEHEMPFFLMVSHFFVHTPVHTRIEWLRQRYLQKLPEDQPRRDSLAHYGAMVTTLDHQVGELLRALDETGLADSTLVVFTSDNGGHPEYAGNAPLRGSKWNLYEGGIRVPFLARWPGRVKPGSTSDSPVVGTDLLPTFADVGKAEVPAKVDGVSLVPVLEQPTAKHRTRNLIWHFPYYHPERGYADAPSRIGINDGLTSQTKPHSVIRSGPYKLAYFYEDDRHEFYVLDGNQSEQIDQAYPAPDIEEQLRQTLDIELKSVAARLPVPNPDSSLMLDLPDSGTDPKRIEYQKLPVLPSKHAMISDVRDRGGMWVHQHAYLAHFDGRYWAMWSDGPGVPQKGISAERHRNRVPGHDRPGTEVSFATSHDGLQWSKPAKLTGPPRIDGFGWIARGFWIRDGELLALATHFNAPGYPGEGLSLEAFRWNREMDAWVAHGTVLDDAMNNFPPKKLPNGQWMMSRRDHQRQVTVMVGGVERFDQWTIRPLAKYAGKQQPEEPYWYTLPDGKHLVGLIRDNSRSHRLLRVFSGDDGQTWSRMITTNFPDATSKFYALRTSRGYYVLVSNSNPKRRDPLTLAVSRDGLVYRYLFHLVGGRHVDYPHIIEQDNHLFVAFSGAKQTMEVLKVSLDKLDEMLAQ